jgi:4,5-DOPA dioxygenase extradiol
MKMPVLFLSHGAPMLALDPGETGVSWRQIAAQLPRPAAILVVSAHWETHIPTVSCSTWPETIHDFSGFPDALYTLRYAAPGAPELAREIAQLLALAEIPVQMDDARGLDHGAWIPLSLMYPAADIPVAQLSIQSDKNPLWHLALGLALRQLREQGVLIIGSGAITHNLPAIFRHPQGAPVPAWVSEFCDWIAAKIAAGDTDALSAYRTLAPFAVKNHPSDEHLLPLFAALGASDDIAASHHLNRVMTYGTLAMDAWLLM